MSNMSYWPSVIEREQGGERTYDLVSRLLRDRIVFLTGEVRTEMSNAVVAQLLFLEADNPERDITLIVNSPGGSVVAGLAIIDTIDMIKCDVSSVVCGQAASMGSLIASACTKGKRMIQPHATHMIHQPLSGMPQSQVSDIEIHTKEVVRLKKELTEIYVRNTGQTYKKLEKDMDRDNFMTAQQSVDYGLADMVVKSRK